MVRAKLGKTALECVPRAHAIEAPTIPRPPTIKTSKLCTVPETDGRSFDNVRSERAIAITSDVDVVVLVGAAGGDR